MHWKYLLFGFILYNCCLYIIGLNDFVLDCWWYHFTLHVFFTAMSWPFLQFSITAFWILYWVCFSCHFWFQIFVGIPHFWFLSVLLLQASIIILSLDLAVAIHLVILSLCCCCPRSNVFYFFKFFLWLLIFVRHEHHKSEDILRTHGTRLLVNSDTTQDSNYVKAREIGLLFWKKKKYLKSLEKVGLVYN